MPLLIVAVQKTVCSGENPNLPKEKEIPRLSLGVHLETLQGITQDVQTGTPHQGEMYRRMSVKSRLQLENPILLKTVLSLECCFIFSFCICLWKSPYIGVLIKPLMLQDTHSIISFGTAKYYLGKTHYTAMTSISAIFICSQRYADMVGKKGGKEI